jgi:two-component system, NarL family, sensor kinase
MPDPHLIPLYIFGTLVVTGFAVAVITSLIIQKQRQVKNRLARQKLAFDYSQSLLNTRIEVQEITLNTVASELHDNIAQALTGCFMQLANAGSMLDDLGSKVYIDEAKENIKGVIKDVRLLSHSLATTMVEHRELQEVIQAELSRIESFSNISCSLRSTTIHELNPEQRLLLFRIIQEALQNILKHAQASNIIISLDSDDTYYRASIKDDGRGFDTKTVGESKSLGLVNMRDRITMLKGELDIDSAPGSGTQIEIQIPLNLPDGKNKNSNSG